MRGPLKSILRTLSVCIFFPNAPVQAADVDFARDIRPIFSDLCFKCHGPDAEQRQADLRLDRKDLGRGTEERRELLNEGDPEKSELYQRLVSNDSGYQMPPPDADRSITSKQRNLIKRWIEEGAEWKSHWAFEPIQRPQPPTVKQIGWGANPIDDFILERLEREKLKPSPLSDRRTLIRRVSLDLTGLPPTPEEVKSYLTDESPEAYERVVDRLLQSPRYGERMAGDWLDAARYADTSGYQNDGPREMWRWRDWVIDAFNENKPFDEFTVEQLAGDLLPNASEAQVIATGFNRNHRGNAEGGIIPEEFQVEYVVDRVETTSTVWLGLTLGCARCHDHKYDPFSQKEFYQLFALFNNIPEHGRAIKEGNSPPYIQAPTTQQRQELAELDERLKELKSQSSQFQQELERDLQTWESENSVPERADWHPNDGLIEEYTFEDDLKMELDGIPQYTKRGEGRAFQFDGQTSLSAGDVANFGYFDKFSFSCWINPKSASAGTILSRMEDVPRGGGYCLVLKEGKLEVNLVERWLDDSIRVATSESIATPGVWTHVLVTYDGSRVASGINVFVNGKQQALDVNLDYINQSFADAEAPFRLGGGNGPEGRFQGMLDDVRIYDRALRPSEVTALSESASISKILKLRPSRRSESQKQKLEQWYLETHASDALKNFYQAYEQLRRDRESFVESIPTVMVMRERKKRRPTFVLTRGQYDQPGEQVQPRVPSAIDALKVSVKDRLAFARWLVDPQNPLTARVIANRMWQQLFGTGLVDTPEDFGSQGALPSHPELLDWLASELIRLEWNLKAFLKTIVMSSTYRQSSRFRPELLERDPDNRLLARSTRIRLSARMLRDQALFTSGLLHEELKGPSVKPYQPAGLWKEIATTKNYEQSKGTDLYRRSLYTYWKRTVAPPNMAIFDAAGREMCVVSSTRTNTPLQALTVMNDVTFLEAARALAGRTFREAVSSIDARIERAYLLTASRKPDAEELSILTEAYQQHLSEYRKNLKEARDLISHGESKPDPKLDPAELAAMTIVAANILNLDEVLTRE